MDEHGLGPSQYIAQMPPSEDGRQYAVQRTVTFLEGAAPSAFCVLVEGMRGLSLLALDELFTSS